MGAAQPDIRCAGVSYIVCNRRLYNRSLGLSSCQARYLDGLRDELLLRVAGVAGRFAAWSPLLGKSGRLPRPIRFGAACCSCLVLGFPSGFVPQRLRNEQDEDSRRGPQILATRHSQHNSGRGVGLHYLLPHRSRRYCSHEEPCPDDGESGHRKNTL